MSDLGPGWAREYFSSPGTVERWWDPVGEHDEAARSWFVAQLEVVLELADVEGQRVLDAATGRGRAAVGSALAGATEVVAVDVSEAMLEIARANAVGAGVEDKVRFEHADLAGLPFEDGRFDRALLLEVLLHFDDPDAVLRELRRVLAPGGWLVVTTNGANPLARLVQPGRRGEHGASRVAVAAATALNEAMTALFGFGWRRTALTRRFYAAIFSVPVRPLYPWQVRRMLESAGFTHVRRVSAPNRFLPREHRWIARR